MHGEFSILMFCAALSALRHDWFLQYEECMLYKLDQLLVVSFVRIAVL